MTTSGWARRGPTDKLRTRGRAWQRIRQRILERDGFACVECGKAGKQVRAERVDHILPVSKGGTDADGNLASLCLDHERLKNIADGVRVAKLRPMIGVDGFPITTR